MVMGYYVWLSVFPGWKSLSWTDCVGGAFRFASPGILSTFMSPSNGK